MKEQQRQHFIDWLKALGMFVIVFGHVFGQPFEFFAPILPKQLGVAFFVFVMGWGLAHDKGKTGSTIFSRVFLVYFYGLALALTLSCIYIFSKNDLNPSNYMPFVGGVNVFFNFFPANPTTWYIGTYIHFILLGVVVLRQIRITALVVILCFLVEVIIRAVILSFGQTFVAYMFISNWLTLFVMGGYLKSKVDIRKQKDFVLVLALGCVCIFLLNKFVQLFPFERSFPFWHIETWQGLGKYFVTSGCITITYLCYTLFAFEICRRIPSGKVIQFFSRNTLIIFLCHMPLIYAISPIWYPIIESNWLKRWVLILIVYLGLALVSEALDKALNPRKIRDEIWGKINLFLLKKG